jgi:hypothetical protein
MENNKELCECGEMANWIYMPGFSNGDSPFFCDDCVNRGCTCNHHYVKTDAYFPPLDNQMWPTKEDEPFKWIEKNIIWCRLDEKGREYPCCEYDYDEEGFDKEIEDGIK